MKRPNGKGLSPEAAAIVAAQGDRTVVHLRIQQAGEHPEMACGLDSGLGQWWSGLLSEVTCVGCKAVWVE